MQPHPILGLDRREQSQAIEKQNILFSFIATAE
jgi:hypothetical protein